MDLLESSSAWLENQRKRFLSRSVAYRRGSQTLPVDATIGKTAFELDDGAGAVIRAESRDFLILAVDLPFGLPISGDQIVDGGIVYEVSQFGNEPAWRYSDPYHKTVRIHTKQVDLEVTP